AILSKLATDNFKGLSPKNKVKAEPLESFLKSDWQKIIKLIEKEEHWAEQNLANYPRKPESLIPKKSSVTEFFRAIRVNPNTLLPLYRQEMPNTSHASHAKNLLLPSEITLLPDSLSPTGQHFIKVKPGQYVLAQDVFTSATDEPDYGLDIELWNDSESSFGAEYKMGKQPFGNSKLSYGSQAPFHMGFYHEWAPLYWVAPNIKRTYPEQRIHLFRSLSRFAFETGHPYWGWRFAGMGAHYVQDLTQPYHTTVLPDKHPLLLILYGILDKLGFSGPKERLIEEATEKHLDLEHKAYEKILKAYYGVPSNISEALQIQPDETLEYTPSYVREELSAESNKLNHKTSLAKLMRNFGKHTRAYLRSITDCQKSCQD
ncbi:MAG: hypothetical protein JKY15_05435, partial [Deltaproteobacteria bacterium]|nr:hypothetical protein [Deltaproteobacteria bacterium]